MEREEGGNKKALVNVIVARKNPRPNKNYFWNQLFETPGFKPKTEKFIKRLKDETGLTYNTRMDFNPALKIDEDIKDKWLEITSKLSSSIQVNDLSEAIDIDLLLKQAYVAKTIDKYYKSLNRFPILFLPFSREIYNKFVMAANAVGIDSVRRTEERQAFINFLMNRAHTNRLYNQIVNAIYNKKSSKFVAFVEKLNTLITNGVMVKVINELLSKVQIQIFAIDINTLRARCPTFDYYSAKKGIGNLRLRFLLFKRMAQKNFGFETDKDGKLKKDKNGFPIRAKENWHLKTLATMFGTGMLLLSLKIGKGLVEAVTAGFGQAHQLPLMMFWFWQGFYRLMLFNTKTMTPSYNGTIYQRAKNSPYFFSGLHSILAWVFDYCEIKLDLCEYIGTFFSGGALAYAAFGAPLLDVQNSTEVRYWFKGMLSNWGFTWLANLIEEAPNWCNRLFSIFWRYFTIAWGSLIMSITTKAILAGPMGYLFTVAAVLISEQTSIMAVGYRYARTRSKARVLLGLEWQAFKIGGWRYSKGFMADMWDYYSGHWKDPWLDCATGEWK
jgi:hypothetical protein